MASDSPNQKQRLADWEATRRTKRLSDGGGPGNGSARSAHAAEQAGATPAAPGIEIGPGQAGDSDPAPTGDRADGRGATNQGQLIPFPRRRESELPQEDFEAGLTPADRILAESRRYRLAVDRQGRKKRRPRDGVAPLRPTP